MKFSYWNFLKPTKNIWVYILAFLLSGCASPPQPSTTSIAEPIRTDPTNSTSPENSQEAGCDPRANERNEVRARHIHVESFATDTSFSKAATPDELKSAYEKISRARDALLRGVSFGQVWDVYADKRGEIEGDLGFVKRGVFVSEFERVAFCIPTSLISPVIRTVYGFHVIQVTDVRY